MDQIEEKLTKVKQPLMALVGGVAAALAVATLPHGFLESIIGATGFSEILPAAAPPLGNTARGLIAVMAGLVSASIIYYFIHQKGGGDMSVALRKTISSNEQARLDAHESVRVAEEKPRFTLPKFSAKSLTQLLKKPRRAPGDIMDLADLPQLRAADSHPDAPARRPLFADSELGAPLASGPKPFEASSIPAVEEAQTMSPYRHVPSEFTMERSITAPPPMMEALPELVVSAPPSDNEYAATMSNHEHAPAPRIERELPKVADLSGLSVPELTERLAAGLARLSELQKATETVSAASHAIPVHTQNHQDEWSEQNMPAPQVPQESWMPQPLKPVEPSAEDIQLTRQADMDAALKAALGTLEKMTAHR